MSLQRLALGGTVEGGHPLPSISLGVSVIADVLSCVALDTSPSTPNCCCVGWLLAFLSWGVCPITGQQLCCVWEGARAEQPAYVARPCPWGTVCVCPCPGPGSPACSGNPEAVDLAW